MAKPSSSQCGFADHGTSGTIGGPSFLSPRSSRLAFQSVRFDLVTLNLVLAIAETRSITRGAEREHLALAAASKRLSDLEARLGVQIFERHARGVELTDAGRALIRHVRQLHASLNAMEDEVADFARGVRGHLRIAANASAISEFLPADLAAFSRVHPGVRISLEDRTSAEVQQAITDGWADVGIFVAPQSEARLATTVYRESTLCLITPRDHPLSQRASVRFEDWLDCDVVGLHEGAAAQQILLSQAREQGRPLKARLQVRGFDAIAQLVEAGMGVAVMPSAVAQRMGRLFGIAQVALDEPWAKRSVLAGVRAQEVLPLVTRRFLEFIAPGGAASLLCTAGVSPASSVLSLSSTSSQS